MASLKHIVKTFRDEIVDGMAWVVIWKEGRCWNVRCFWETDGDYENGLVFEPDEIDDLLEIASIDHKAICFNGYYCGFGYDFSNEEIENKIRWFYEERRNQLQGDFLECLVVH